MPANMDMRINLGDPNKSKTASLCEQEIVVEN